MSRGVTLGCNYVGMTSAFLRGSVFSGVVDVFCRVVGLLTQILATSLKTL